MELLDYLKEAQKNNVNLGQEIYQYFCTTDLPRLSALKTRIEQVRLLKVKGSSKKARSFRGKQSRHVGLLLERLMLLLLGGCSCLKVDTNVNLTTAEIDYLVRIGPDASFFPMFREAGTHAIGEAKCVSAAPSTEWINELAGILATHGASLGFLFTAAPPKKLAHHARTAVALHCVAGKTIVLFGFTQVQRVLNGENFLEVLTHQYVSTRSHTSSLSV